MDNDRKHATKHSSEPQTHTLHQQRHTPPPLHNHSSSITAHAWVDIYTHYPSYTMGIQYPPPTSSLLFFLQVCLSECSLSPPIMFVMSCLYIMPAERLICCCITVACSMLQSCNCCRKYSKYVFILLFPCFSSCWMIIALQISLWRQ